MKRRHWYRARTVFLTAALLVAGCSFASGDGSVAPDEAALPGSGDVQAWSGSASRPLPAFPGAEGAGRFAVGGRGGDVYYVTNLNDSGPGSLRHGIESASGPRTIVFDVAGIIYLQGRLTVEGKSNLTIAGQTAPGEGITLANRSFFIRHSDNIIVQNIRCAPGDGLTRPGTEDMPGHLPYGNPRSIRVWNSRNVIVDHVTARWGSEDNIGVSHGSSYVTIQNSFAAEGLRNADHFKGERGYAMVIGGSHNSSLCNLLTQNRARNPRSGEGLFEFSNNIIYNPGYIASTFTGNIQANYNGNIGIAGLDSSSPEAMILGWGDNTPQVYAAGNFYDRNSQRPLNLEGTIATIVGDPTEVSSPFQISNYEKLSTRQAYIHILSRGGAAVGRDLHDKRAVRDVVERGGRHLDRPDDVGGYGRVEPGKPPISTARDGIPDWWKIEKGLDIDKQYHQVYADDGYTYLEKYLHSLMEPVLAPVVTERIVIEASEWPRKKWPAVDNDGGYVMVRFDLSSVRGGSIADAWLELKGIRKGAQVLARDPMVEASKWNVAAAGIDPKTYKTSPWRLGEFFEDGKFDSPNLAVFLNTTLLHYGNEKDNEIVTLMIDVKDSGVAPRPRLVLHAVRDI